MPRYCCVPNCTSNKPGQPYVTSFRFPKDPEKRELWKKKIPRDFDVKNDTVVCVMHFSEDCIVKHDVITLKDGTEKKIDRLYPKLSEDAYPSIFPCCPKYLSEKKTTRTATLERQKKMQKFDDDFLDEWLKKDRISNLVDIEVELSKTDCRIAAFLKENSISVHKCENCISFLFINCEKCPEVHKCIKIDTKLFISLSVGKQLVTDMNKILSVPQKLSCWGELENVLSFAKCYDAKEKINIERENNHELAVQYWKAYVHENCEPEHSDLGKFILEQMQLVVKPFHGRKYSSNLIVFAYCVFMKSSSCYSYLHDSQMLCLPSLRHLKRLSVDLKVIPGIVTEENKFYLKTICENMSQHEKIVNVLIDEIYIKPCVTYKHAQLVGFTHNKSGEQASTIQVFMYTSLFSKSKEIIALVPVTKMTTTDLLQMTKQVINFMDDMGFTILTVISDNNRVNRNMFVQLSGGTELKSCIQNPFNSSKKLFLLFDTVHLIKSVRNNWLNQADSKKTFIFPDPNNYHTYLDAPFSLLEDIYKQESNTLMKTAPKLSRKALNPSNIERQNVKLALKIFDVSNSIALRIFGQQNIGVKEVSESTALFIEHINSWWEMMNIKNPKKGYHLRLSDAVPFSSPDDIRIQFLEGFVNWLKEWKEQKQKSRQGGLSAETFFALTHTTTTIVQIIRHLLLEHKVHYILTGKFQTDHLEARFGQYRQMSGSNYYASVQQILEAEKKLRIKSILKLHSIKFGSVTFKDFIITHTAESTSLNQVDICPFQGILDSVADYDSISHNDVQVLTYIGGYCVHQLGVTCSSCLHNVTINKDMDFEIEEPDVFQYLKALNRGGLKIPSTIVVKIISTCFLIFKSLLSEQYEASFLYCPNQLGVPIRLSQLYLANNEIFDTAECLSIIFLRI